MFHLHSWFPLWGFVDNCVNFTNQLGKDWLFIQIFVLCLFVLFCFWVTALSVLELWTKLALDTQRSAYLLRYASPRPSEIFLLLMKWVSIILGFRFSTK